MEFGYSRAERRPDAAAAAGVQAAAADPASIFGNLRLPDISALFADSGKDSSPPSVAKSNLVKSAGVVSGFLLKIQDLAVTALDSILSAMAADPKAVASIQSGLAGLGIDLVPFLGPLKKFADGRALVFQNNPALKVEGRTLCVIAALEMALDAATAGGSALLPDEILTYPRMFRDYQRRINQESDPSKFFPDPVSLLVRGLLSIPGASAFVDRVLNASRPESKKNY